VIWAKYSKEFAEMQKLRKEDPEAFKVKSKAFREKVRKEIKAEREKFKKLVMEYRKTKDPKTREAISKYVSDAYDRRLNAAAKIIVMQKKRLEKTEKRLAEAKAKKEERINKKLKIILRDPKLNW
jgi:t-SNARE complex subunit (syntaxin)